MIHRLSKKLELLDGYARVMNMIEIEVEMEIELPEAELVGIEQQMVRLQELEGLQDDWRVQAEARDEVRTLVQGQESEVPIRTLSMSHFLIPKGGEAAQSCVLGVWTGWANINTAGIRTSNLAPDLRRISSRCSAPKVLCWAFAIASLHSTVAA